MKFALLILLAFIADESAKNYDYYLSLGYYSKPIKNLEWSITVFRDKGRMIIDVSNFLSKRFRSELSLKHYKNLLEGINKNGIWTLKDRYQKNSKNAYYLLEVKEGGYSNRFRYESGPLASGDTMRYQEIIRSITNLARLYSRE